MSNSLLKNFGRIPSFCAPVFGLFFVVSLISCAGNGQPLTESDPRESAGGSDGGSSYTDNYFDDGAQASSGNGSQAARRNTATDFASDGFSFSLPQGDWALVGDVEAHESGVPYEFYNASTGRRAVLVEIELPKGEPMRLMDRAQMEMQAFESSGKKATLAETYPEEAFGGTGVFFDVAGKRYDSPYEAVGFVTGAGSRVYTLTLSATDTQLPPGELKNEWKEFFANFSMRETAANEGPELSPNNVQSFNSPALGYTWAVKDTLWHHWTGIARQNDDPDLVLSNKAEDVSLFVYGATVESDAVNSQDLFKVLLVRLGVDPNNPTIEMHRQKVGDRYAQDFTLTHVVNKFDFYYTGRYFYDDGRGIMIVSWTQGVNKKKYSKVMQHGIEGLTVGEKPATASDAESAKKQAKFNAAIMSQVGILRLLENQPLVALSYFERANRMDPEEPLYLINCGFQMRTVTLAAGGSAFRASNLRVRQTSAK